MHLRRPNRIKTLKYICKECYNKSWGTCFVISSVLRKV